MNPDAEWVVFLDQYRFHVAADGSFSSGSILPSTPNSLGNWTLHYTQATTDGYHYERMIDHPETEPISVERFTNSIAGSGQEFAVGSLGDFTHRTEDIAHGENNISIALWSTEECDYVSSLCNPFLKWRLIDH